MKEFDIRLPPRLTECKVLIYSLPYYSGLTVIDGFVVDSAVDEYTLQKAFNAQSGLVLKSEVENAVKIVHEIAQSGLVLDSHVVVKALRKFTPEPSGIVLLEESARLSAEGFLCVDSGIELDSSLLDIQLSHSLGYGESAFIINSSVDGTLKVSSLADIQTGFVLQAESLDTKRLNRFTADNGILLTSELKNLCYLICFGMDNSIALDSEATGILLKVLYGAENGVVLDTEASTSTVKRIHTESGIVISVDIACVPVKVVEPEGSGIVLNTKSSADLKRYRLLEELDDMALEDIDDMTLEELDWVWLT